MGKPAQKSLETRTPGPWEQKPGPGGWARGPRSALPWASRFRGGDGLALGWQKCSRGARAAGPVDADSTEGRPTRPLLGLAPRGGAQCDGGRTPGVRQAGQSVSNTLERWAPPSRPSLRLVWGRASGRSNSLPLDSALRFLNVGDLGADDPSGGSVSAVLVCSTQDTSLPAHKTRRTKKLSRMAQGSL